MVVVTKYDVTFKQQVLDLLLPLWGHMSPEKRETYFKWKYLDNPWASDVLYFTAIDDAKQKVVGVLGFLIVQYHLNGHPVNIATISDGVIHNEYRRQGIYDKLIRFGMDFVRENHGVFFCNALSGNYPANQGLIKLGSIPVAEKKINYKTSLCGRFKHPGKKYSFICAKEPRPEDMAGLCKKLRNENVLSLNKTKEYLAWRYNNPHSRYGFAYVYKDNTLVAFISYYMISGYRFFILDYAYTEPEIFRSLVKFLIKNEKCRMLQLWTISKNSRELNFLHTIGFRPYITLLRLLKKEIPSPVLVRPCIPEYKESDFMIDGMDVRNEFNWEFNLICTDGI